MRAHLPSTAVAVIVAGAACAQGTSSLTGAGGGSTGPLAGGGGACSESPCKLAAPQCGCPAGQACSLDQGVVACQTPGTAGVTQACSPGQCAAGLVCVGGASGACGQFCETDADCSSLGGICGIDLVDGTGTLIPNASVCSVTCDVTTSTGCPAGTACQIQREATGSRWLTTCTSAGSKGPGEMCVASFRECRPTLACLATSQGGQPTCLPYCFVGETTCNSGSCQALTDSTGANIVVGGMTIGVCE